MSNGQSWRARDRIKRIAFSDRVVDRFGVEERAEVAGADGKEQRIAFTGGLRGAEIVHGEDRVDARAEGAGEFFHRIAVAQSERADGDIGVFVSQTRRARGDQLGCFRWKSYSAAARRKNAASIRGIQIANDVFID